MDILEATHLEKKFHDIFQNTFDNIKLYDLTNVKKQKIKSKENSHSDVRDLNLPWIDLSPNASKFAIYHAVRSLVLENDAKLNKKQNRIDNSHILKNTITWQGSIQNAKLTDSNKDKDDVNEIGFDDHFEFESVQKIPVIVGAGLRSLYELISDTRIEHPQLCSKAIQALFDIVQVQNPESFKSEPEELFTSMYNLLLNLATLHGPSTVDKNDANNWSSISCAAVLALSVARGDTGKILKSISSIIMSSKMPLNQNIQLPQILLTLQRSVYSVALGKLQLPTYFSNGLSSNSLIDHFNIKEFPLIDNVNQKSCITSDGKYIYALIGRCLLKIGSGYAGTLKGFIYCINKEFGKDKTGWIGMCNNTLYYKRITKRSMDYILIVDTETLTVTSAIQVDIPTSKEQNSLIFSDGISIYSLCTGKDDSLSIKQIYSKNTFALDFNIKLAKKKFQSLGYSCFEEEILNDNQITKIISTNNTFIPVLPNDMELANVICGKEFGLIRCTNGKVFYYGRGSSLGIKSASKTPCLKLNELLISKNSNIMQTAVGHDGIHALLLNDDGAVYFTGTSRRGEDGEISKNRRQFKAVKPKKITKIEGHFIVHISCNNGTSAFVTKTGKVIMFGKDTNYCDSFGFVTNLHDHTIVKVALGKAHCVALNDKGQLFTYGLNNKGQCGRNFPKEKSSIAEDTTKKPSEEQVAQPFSCEIEEHKITEGQCKICSKCNECTGYNRACVTTLKIPLKDRYPGSNCSCGHGNAGCSKCGICLTCISMQETESDDKNLLNSNSDALKTPLKKKIVKNEEIANVPDAERDTPRVTPIPPQKLNLPNNSVVTQLSCGLHHTVVLTASGEVYTFGSNQYGQLGTGDLQSVSGPYQVKIPYTAVQVAAGSNHTIILAKNGTVFSFGNYQRGQLGRNPSENTNEEKISASSSSGQSTDPKSLSQEILIQRQKFLWNCAPTPMTGIGPAFGRKPSWIGASGDQTFLRIDESLVNAATLSEVNVAADRNFIILFPNNVSECIVINKKDRSCKSHNENQFDIQSFLDKPNIFESMNKDKLLVKNYKLFASDSGRATTNLSFAIDSVNTVLWVLDANSLKLLCFNVIASDILNNAQATKDALLILSPDVVLPMNNNAEVSRYNASINLLACLDILSTVQPNLTSCFESTSMDIIKSSTTKVDSNVYSTVNRFGNFGGGWGYSGQSIEAILFSVNTDIELGGVGVYGGRGEYSCKIKVYDMGFNEDEVDKDGTVIAESDEIPYECQSKTKFNILLQNPIHINAKKWYLLCAKISGPSSDCGSLGQSTISTDDNVIFKFKSTKKSNNGTDINSGQIPSILYRLLTPDHRDSSNFDTVCKVSEKFANTLSQDCFENLVSLLEWSWNTFKFNLIESNDVKKKIQIEISLNRLLFICKVCLRLLKKYTNEIYPHHTFRYIEQSTHKQQSSSTQDSKIKSPKPKSVLTSNSNDLSFMETNTPGNHKRINSENLKLAESIGNVRALLISILCDEFSNGSSAIASNMVLEILDECNETFISCFNAFYPTSLLKWECLCDLLIKMDKGTLHSRLLSCVLAGLGDPTVNLKTTFSMLTPNVEHKTITSPSDNSGFPMLLSTENYQYPILVEQMMYRTQKEKKNTAVPTLTFKDVLTRLLDIISRPINTNIENIFNNQSFDIYNGDEMKKSVNHNLIDNCCKLLSKMLSEIIYQGCANEFEAPVTSSHTLHSTGNRFIKCDATKTWNTGNFGPDAISFTVDRPGISIAGASVYSGTGRYEYQLELLYDSLESTNQLHHKWEVLESVSGTYDQDVVRNNLTEIKFERPMCIKENVRYALRLCSQGAKTCSGDGGLTSVRGPCGVTFKFYLCNLSFNGTTPARGQLPCLLYYSENIQGKNSREMYAREQALQIASDITKRCTELLIYTRNALTFSSSSSDKSSNYSNTTHTIDSEHNITPIEEHFDISWINNVENVNTITTNESTPLNTKDFTKRIETFSKGIIESLKFDKKLKNPNDIEVDIGAKELTPNDIILADLNDRNFKNDDKCNINGNTRKYSQPKGAAYNEINDIDENFSHINYERVMQLFTTKDASLFHTLLPSTFAYISSLVSNDPKSCVEVLNLIREILPHITALNLLNQNRSSDEDKTELLNYNTRSQYDMNVLGTTSNYFCVVESDHPYKSTQIYSYRVEFPSCVKWMSIEFDPLCGTNQPEDYLLVKIPTTRFSTAIDTPPTDWITVKKFNIQSQWCQSTIILPGNIAEFSLETASNYLRDVKGNKYGFKCLVIGYNYDNKVTNSVASLKQLEYEMSYLGGMCSANLLHKDLMFSDDLPDDIANAEETLNKYSGILSNGLLVPETMLTINNALDSILPVGSQSFEKQFLNDFIYIVPGSAGARLAAWIQPESRLDPNRCELKVVQEPLRCGWPTQFIIETKDQYGNEVYVPNINIEVKATADNRVSYDANRKNQRNSRTEPIYLNSVFLPPKVAYEPTVKEKEKTCIKSITAMKAYAQYSFEEIRCCSPLQSKTTESINAYDLGNYKCAITWTPLTPGNYNLSIIVDGITIDESYNVEVIDGGTPPPSQKVSLKKVQQPNKLRKFIAKNSAGLRIRLHPTLQSEQIGIVKDNGIISYTDELENDDGIWVRLSTESIREYCEVNWFPTEAWCLQFNQHLDKTLLHQVTSNLQISKTLVDQISEQNPSTSEDLLIETPTEIKKSLLDLQEKVQPVLASTNPFLLPLNSSYNENLKGTSDDVFRLDKSKITIDIDTDAKNTTSSNNMLLSHSAGNPSNLTAAIVGVVGEGAIKLQALQKWFKGDGFENRDFLRKKSDSVSDIGFVNNLNEPSEFQSNGNLDGGSPQKKFDSVSKLKTSETRKYRTASLQENSLTKDFTDSIIGSTASMKLSTEAVKIPAAPPVCPKRALSPAIAETLRAVFAAFVWHEGLVHDSMACASFLKFNPTISKDEKTINLNESEENVHYLTREEKVQQRHSVEIANAGSYLNIRPSTLETLNKMGYCCIHNRRNKNKNSDFDFSAKKNNVSEVDVLPPALKCLVYVWDQLCKNFVHLLENNTNEKDNEILCHLSNTTKPTDDNDRENKKYNKKKDEGCWCELCDIFLQIPVTYHMRIVHPGCGKPSKGKGYNSIGVYCEGWAGNCGEGGQGASSWYLMCDKCREKCMGKSIGNMNNLSENMPSISHSTSANVFGPNSNNILSSELFSIMKENSLFLLELNSRNGILKGKKSEKELSDDYCKMFNDMTKPDKLDARLQNHMKIFQNDWNEVVNASGGRGRSPRCSNMKFLPPELYWNSPDFILCLETLDTRAAEGFFNNNNNYEQKTVNDGIFDCGNSSRKKSPVLKPPSLNKFHRSYSMGQGWNTANQNKYENSLTQDNSMENVNAPNCSNVVLRKKNTCSCSEQNLGISTLLRFPSNNLKRLVPDYITESSPKLMNDSDSCTVHKNDPKKTTESRNNEDLNFFDFMETYNNSAKDLSNITNNININEQTTQKSNKIDNIEFKPDVEANAISLLSRPSMTFILERHDLKKLKYLMIRNLRTTICNVYSMEALNWLLRSVTQTTSIHDIMWWFVSALTPTVDAEEELKNDDVFTGLEHPASFNKTNGPSNDMLSQSFHNLLQTIADLTLHLPSGSDLQRISIQCFGLKFKQADHQFLHRSHVFGNISKILSRSEEQNDDIESKENSVSNFNNISQVMVNWLIDLTDLFEITVSSRQALVNSLIDNSTETFWESDDEDRNKPKFIECALNKSNYLCKAIYVHVDNSRDIGNKVSTIIVYGGQSFAEVTLLKSLDVEPMSCEWLCAYNIDDANTHFRLEIRGLESTLRIRQIKLMGNPIDSVHTKMKLSAINAMYIQQKNCETETLKVFRLLTSQVFGKLIVDGEKNQNDINLSSSGKVYEQYSLSPQNESLDLREHMVGILFSRSKLTHLQKQIIVYIVHAIQKETVRSKEEWETNNCSCEHTNDTYCFEMLSMVLALSGSAVGRSYLSQQFGLIKDLFTLLHTGSDRVQRQVTSLIRRILPEISPETFCDVLHISKIPPTDFYILSQNNDKFNMNSLGILDTFLALIAKSLHIQVKIKSKINSNKYPAMAQLRDYIGININVEDILKNSFKDEDDSKMLNFDTGASSTGCTSTSSAPIERKRGYTEFEIKTKIKKVAGEADNRWFMGGTISAKQSENIINLIKDMANGKLTEKWSLITKAAIAECIVNLTRLDETHRIPENCIKTPTLWLALASLCVLDLEHVERLSSSQWSKHSETIPFCTNHDDGVTSAIIECNTCGSLCSDCDRYLHLNKKTKKHYRTVCKEEEESIRVELHESCGRTKLFWLLALADYKTLKGVIEFRDGNTTITCDPLTSLGRCRYCGISGTTGLLSVGNVCADPQCQDYAANACRKINSCGHSCGGILDEEKCLPCLNHKCHAGEKELNTQSLMNVPKLTQDSDDMCMICFTEALACAPAIQLECGHVFHHHCCKAVLLKRWNGPRISFGFSQCPICKSDIYHASLTDILNSIVSLKNDVKRKALMRLEYEGTSKNSDYKDMAAYAMDRYAYYVCSQCQKAYYGGEARCDADMGESYDPQELVCGGCSDIARAHMCPKHGTDFLEYKCRYCCSVAVFFCFGTTHFCDTCHDDFQRLTNIPKNKLPKCPAGPKAKQLHGDECPLHIIHPATGEEFALGCGICRNAQTF